MCGDMVNHMCALAWTKMEGVLYGGGEEVKGMNC